MAKDAFGGNPNGLHFTLMAIGSQRSSKHEYARLVVKVEMTREIISLT